MTNTIKLFFLAILNAFALWRTQSHDDAMTLVTAGMVTLCFVLSAWHVWRNRKKKEPSGSFFYGDKETGRSQRSEVAKSLG